jgi:sphingolipid delta-4 desaturase
VLEKDFTWSETDEPHRSRRQAILKAHPEMKALFVKEPKTFLIVAFST